VAIAAMLWFFVLQYPLFSESLPPKLPKPMELLPGYVGAEMCANCHVKQSRDYQNVGMAHSLYKPTPKNLPEFPSRRASFFHQRSGFHYEMLTRNGKYYQKRFILDSNGRPIHVHQEEITYVIGSGKHARSYLSHHPDGRITQLPVSWYPQEGRWAMSPGFDSAIHPDFSRDINHGCIFCHDAYPKLIPSLSPVENLFPYELPSGIDCERCHGPGGQHVQLALAGRPTELIVASIFQPSRAPKNIQRELCYQCHFEAGLRFARDRIYRPDREVFSYHPGEPLSNVMINLDYAPHDRPADEFKVTHQGYRMEQSVCFQKSGGEMTCTTCHDPHQVIGPKRRVGWYRSKCLQCHRQDSCTVAAAARKRQNDDCTACHMWKRRTQDSVHTIFTDHKIQEIKPAQDYFAPLSEESPLLQVNKDLTFTTGQQLNPLEQKYFLTMAYLQLPPEQLTISERQRSKGLALLQGFIEGAKHSESSYAKYLSRAYFTLAASYRADGQQQLAVDAYEQSLHYDARFVPAYDNLGGVLAEMENSEQAFECFRSSLTLNPWDAMAYRNAGSLYAWNGSFDRAIELFRSSLSINPDNAGTYQYLGKALSDLGQYGPAVVAFEEALKIEPRSAGVYWDCAAALHKQGNKPLALEYVRTGLHYSPNDPRGNALLSQIDANHRDESTGSARQR
jgi:tetratricopeptide (TPR) repeat protein